MDNPKNPVLINSIKLYSIDRLNNNDLTMYLITTTGPISMGTDIRIFPDFFKRDLQN